MQNDAINDLFEDLKGEFNIEVIENDTIVFTSVQHKSLMYIVSFNDIKKKELNISLETQVNELPEAVIGFTSYLFRQVP